ncbi:MAG: hypothetical protein HN509_14125 [Halobacteriovoraceae bacterium]|jgi:hypothetical protein|nr:hypothetical protein [Halobacteriovoraceae bacterium]
MDFLSWDWLLVGLFMAGLAYTLIVVKNEQANYLKNALTINILKFRFKVPAWWGLERANDQHIIFERKDTRYDWKAELVWVPESNSEQKLESAEIFKKKLAELQIEFDRDTTIIKNPTDFQERPEVKNGKLEIIRIEGTATQAKEHRLYYDAFFIRSKEMQGHLYCSSRSSILNGAVEGPYFEQAINNFEIVPD